MQKIISIQILRGLAALLVVTFHCLATVIPDRLSAGESPILGAAGVDIFFVISGFVMWVSTIQRPATPAHFLLARFVRVAPLYYLATLVYLGILALQARIPAAFSVNEVLYSLLFIPFTNSIVHQDVPILGVGWTLNYEALFYLTFGIALHISHASHRAGFIALTFFCLVAGRFWLPSDTPLLVRFTSPLFFEFFAGILIAARYLATNKRRPVSGVLLAFAGVVLLGLVPVYAPWLPRTIAWGGPASMIVCGVVECEALLRGPRWRPMLLLGNASYSIYLVHDIVLDLLTSTVLPHLDVWLFFPPALLLSVVLGVAVYHLVEAPLLRAMRQGLGHPRLH